MGRVQLESSGLGQRSSYPGRVHLLGSIYCRFTSTSTETAVRNTENAEASNNTAVNTYKNDQSRDDESDSDVQQPLVSFNSEARPEKDYIHRLDSRTSIA